MIRKILTTSLITAAILFSGCGDSEGESRLETQQMLDSADYDGVIAKLSSASLTAEDNLALGAAYMGRAGLSLADLINVVGDSGNNGSNDAFGSFIGSVADATAGNGSALSDITNATKHYTNVIGTLCGDDNAFLSDSQKDVCIYKGLSQTMGAATAMNYIAEDIGSVFESDNEDNKLATSTCAMKYAISNGNDEGECAITSLGNITFANGKTYEEIEVNSNGETYNYLLTQTTPRSTAVTNGYCSNTDFTTRTDTPTEGYYVCPVQEDGNAEEITTGTVIADALNNGVDSIGVAADEEMQADIQEFKAEVLASSGKNENDTITEEDVVNYLNENN